MAGCLAARTPPCLAARAPSTVQRTYMAQVRNRTCTSYASQTQTGADADPELKEQGSEPPVQDDVERALKSALNAAESAESALEGVSNLPSSRVTPQVCSQNVPARRYPRFPCSRLVALACTKTSGTQVSAYRRVGTY